MTSGRGPAGGVRRDADRGEAGTTAGQLSIRGSDRRAAPRAPVSGDRAREIVSRAGRNSLVRRDGGGIEARVVPLEGFALDLIRSGGI